MSKSSTTINRWSTLILLTPLQRYSDLALLLVRLVVGSFLVWGVSDNIFSSARMHEFELFLTQWGFPAPRFMAPLSVWAQLLVGVSFIFGLFIRGAGIICAINFIVAIALVDIHGGIRASFPAAALVVIGFYIATKGAGRFSFDNLLTSRPVA